MTKEKLININFRKISNMSNRHVKTAYWTLYPSPSGPFLHVYEVDKLNTANEGLNELYSKCLANDRQLRH